MSKLDYVSSRVNDRIFNAIYKRSLVYNTCWEDPAVDRKALELEPKDRMLVITSAGCNVLDYAIRGPEHIDSVDANPRQTALLELKIAAIRSLGFEDFFQIFGNGYHPEFREVYGDVLVKELDGFTRSYWDKKGQAFYSKGPEGSFYYRGLSGQVARLVRIYINARPKLRSHFESFLNATRLDEQREIYDANIMPLLWGPKMNWILSRQMTMNMLGVPHPQRREVENAHTDGVAAFIRDSIEYVFRQLPIWMNYFWSLYLRGGYTRENCPEYLKEENFNILKNGYVDRISPHTTTVTDFLSRQGPPVSRYVLLDHMDWMSTYYPAELVKEWQHIFNRASDNARILFRSAHAEPAYLQQISVVQNSKVAPILDKLNFHPDWAAELTREDRVHTYAGFHIADVAA
ncbi:MAG: DUF3419 family protein [Thiotrichales bacterium]